MRQPRLKAGVPCPGRIWAQDRLEQAPPFGEERVPTALSSGDLLLPRLARVALGAPRWCPYSLPVRGRPSGQDLRDIGTSDRGEGPELRGRYCKTFWLRTGPCRALGADPPRDAELRGDLACRRLGSERKYVKRIHARDTGQAGRQFAR